MIKEISSEELSEILTAVQKINKTVNLEELSGIQTETKKKKRLALEELPEILTAQIIADYLIMSRRRIYELFQLKPSEGGIRNFEIGNSKRVEKDDFVEWILARKSKKEAMIG
jgi:hypothetical protein